jgi:hypothetical protein
MATSPAAAVTEWDAQGNPHQSVAPSATEWDASGNPAAPTAAPTSPTGPTSGSAIGNFAGGAMESAAKTAVGAANLVGAGIEKITGKPAGTFQATPDFGDKNAGIAQKAGQFTGDLLQFIATDGALGDLDMAGKIGLSSKVAQLAQQSPRLARAIEIGINAVRSGVTGGALGATTAAANNEPIVAGAEHGARDAALGSAVGEGVVGPAVNKVGEKLEEFAPKIGNALLQANKIKNFQYGKNPGQTFIDEQISAKPWQDYSDVKKSLDDAGNKIANEAQQAIASSPNANKKIDVVPNVDQIFDNALQSLTSKSGLPDRRGLITDLEILRQEVTHDFDVTGTPRAPKGPLTPAEITKLKTSIGRGTKWDPTKAAESQQFLNGVRKQVYSYLDSEVDNAVPEMQGINERWANQIEASQLIDKRVAQEQAAAYGHSKAVHRGVLGSAAVAIASGNPLIQAGGAAALLNEAARSPAARIATGRVSAAAGKALQTPAAAAEAARLAAGAGSAASQQ